MAAAFVALCVAPGALAADFLQPSTSPEPSQAGPAGAAVGDVDNDGDMDIVTSALFSTTASTLLNNGVGDFSEVSIGSNAATIDAGLGDFDTDSNLDLVLLYPQTPPATGFVAMFRGNGNGTFTFVGPSAIVATGVRPTQLWVEDFNGDGTDDVAVVNSQNAPTTTNGTVVVFFGNPADNDTFAQSTPNFTMTVQLGATDVVGGNFNGGARDLVVSNYQSNSISLLSGLGTGNFTVTNIGTTVSPFYMDAGDLNGDGNTDVVATVRNSSPTSIRTMFGNGAGAFPTQTTVTAATAATGTLPQQVVARNFDADADIDLAIANGVPNTVSVLDNDGTGTFTIAPTSPETGIGTTAGTVPFGIVSADFDGSTFDDLAVTVVFTAPGQVSILLNQTEPVADLAIDKQDTGFDPVTVGDDITYSLVVTNSGPNDATNVHATDTLPAGLTFVSSPDGCTESGGVVDCDFGDVASGATETQTFVVSTDAAAAPSVSDTATVDGDETDPDLSDNSDTETTTVNVPSGGGTPPPPPPPPPTPSAPSADLSIDKQDAGFDPVTVGDDITYSLVVTNSGPNDATNVHATDTLPAGLTFVSSPDGCTESGGVVDCDFGDVASGATETQTFVVSTDAAAAPSVSDTATVDGDESDPDLSDNSDTETTTVNASATCRGRRATLIGTSAGDLLVGTPGNDVIVALGGDDVVLGGAGNDLICGGGGNDRLVGGLGNDELFGGLGVDLLFGGRGGDLLNGGIGNDTLNGGRGDDRLFGRQGRDKLFGKQGKDRLNGGRGGDVLNGGAGRDRLVGGPGNDRLVGGLGSDVLFGGSGRDLLLGGRGNDTLNGGAGRDRLVGGPGDDRSPLGPIA